MVDTARAYYKRPTNTVVEIVTPKDAVVVRELHVQAAYETIAVDQIQAGHKIVDIGTTNHRFDK